MLEGSKDSKVLSDKATREATREETIYSKLQDLDQSLLNNIEFLHSILEKISLLENELAYVLVSVDINSNIEKEQPELEDIKNIANKSPLFNEIQRLDEVQNMEILKLLRLIYLRLENIRLRIDLNK